MSAPVTWFEINTSNAPEVQKFYSELFGWQFARQEEDSDYATIEAGEGGIGGGIGGAEATGSNQVTLYIQVDDIQGHLDRVEAAGGRTVLPVTEIAGMLSYAQFSDPEGNVLGLVTPAS